MARYVEMVVSLGLGLGPLIGSIVYDSLEYEGTMYLFALLLITVIILCAIFIPGKFNQNAIVQEENN